MGARILINKATIRRWLELPEEARLSLWCPASPHAREVCKLPDDTALVVYVELPSTPVTPQLAKGACGFAGCACAPGTAKGTPT